MNGTASDPGDHLLLNQVLVVPEDNKIAHGIDQEQDQDGDNGKLFQAFISG